MAILDEIIFMNTTEKILYIKNRLRDFVNTTCKELGVDNGLTILIMEAVMADLYRDFQDTVLIDMLNSENTTELHNSHEESEQI